MYIWKWQPLEVRPKSNSSSLRFSLVDRRASHKLITSLVPNIMKQSTPQEITVILIQSLPQISFQTTLLLPIAQVIACKLLTLLWTKQVVMLGPILKSPSTPLIMLWSRFRMRLLQRHLIWWQPRQEELQRLYHLSSWWQTLAVHILIQVPPQLTNMKTLQPLSRTIRPSLIVNTHRPTQLIQTVLFTLCTLMREATNIT